MADQITWTHKGKRGCKGNTTTTRDPDGTTLRTTCDRCKLEWTMTEVPAQ